MDRSAALSDRLASELRDALAEAENGNASGAMCYVDRAQEIWESALPSEKQAATEGGSDA